MKVVLYVWLASCAAVAARLADTPVTNTVPTNDCCAAAGALSDTVISADSDACASSATNCTHTAPAQSRSPALDNGTLRKLNQEVPPRTQTLPDGTSTTVLRDEHGNQRGSAHTIPLPDGSTTSIIRDDHAQRVGHAHTFETSIGTKTVLRDEDGNKVGSVHRVGDATIYRDENGHRLSHKEAKERGLR